MEADFVIKNSLIEEEHKSWEVNNSSGIISMPYYIRMCNRESINSMYKLNELGVEFTPDNSEVPLKFKYKNVKYFARTEDYIVSEEIISNCMEWMWEGIVGILRENNSERLFTMREEDKHRDMSKDIQDCYYLEYRTPLDKIHINFQFAEEIDEHKLYISTSHVFISDIISIIEHIYYSIRDISANPYSNQLDNLLPFAFSSTTLLHQKRITIALFTNLNTILLYFVKGCQTALKYNSGNKQLEIQISLIYDQETKELKIKGMPCKENIQQTILIGLIQREISKIREAIKYVCNHPNNLGNINLTHELHFEESIILENYTYSVYLLYKTFQQSFLYRNTHKYKWSI